jgi:uncharacterized protein
VDWIWTGIGVLVGLPLLVAVLLVILMIHLRLRYIAYLERVFEEIPYFNVPRGQPDPQAEDVRFRTADGLNLCGCYFKAAGKRKGVILFAPEYGANRWSCSDYCHHLYEAGYDVFAFEPRNHGESDKEPKLEAMHWSMDRDVIDIRAALAYLKSRPDADSRGVGLFGVSKGAGAGILAAANEPMIRCAVTDGMFAACTTMVPYMRHWITIYNRSYFIQGLLPSWYYAILARWAIRRVGARRGVRFLHLEPALHCFNRIHGQMDKYIRADMALALFDLAREPKEFWLIPDANHNQGLHVAGDEYRRRLREFIDKHLGQ